MEAYTYTYIYTQYTHYEADRAAFMGTNCLAYGAHSHTNNPTSYEDAEQ